MHATSVPPQLYMIPAYMQEIFTFLNMGGLVENVDVLPIGGDDVTLDMVQGWFNDFRGQDAQVCSPSWGVHSSLRARLEGLNQRAFHTAATSTPSACMKANTHEHTNTYVPPSVLSEVGPRAAPRHHRGLLWRLQGLQRERAQRVRQAESRAGTRLP